MLLTERVDAQAGETQFKLLKATGFRLEAIRYLDPALDISRSEPHVGSPPVIDTLLGLSSPFRLADTNLAASALSLDPVLQPSVLTSAELSKGHLQPYLAVGPQAIVVTEADQTSKFTRPRDRQVGLTTSLGVKMGAWPGRSTNISRSSGSTGISDQS